MKQIVPKHKFYNSVIKRFFDIAVSLLVMLCFSWLYLFVAVAVLINFGWPIIFTHRRPGKIDPNTGKEKLFNLYKFRSMTNEVDSEGVLLPSADRLTKFGKKLRLTSLDELPELWNIFIGDMSLVGPRPWNEKALPYYTEAEHMRHNVRPGLTGLAQINGRNVSDWCERIKYDLYYVENVSFLMDLKIILKTVKKVFMHEDIVEAGKQIFFWDYREQQWRDGVLPNPELFDADSSANQK